MTTAVWQNVVCVVDEPIATESTWHYLYQNLHAFAEGHIDAPKITTETALLSPRQLAPDDNGRMVVWGGGNSPEDRMQARYCYGTWSWAEGRLDVATGSATFKIAWNFFDFGPDNWVPRSIQIGTSPENLFYGTIGNGFPQGGSYNEEFNDLPQGFLFSVGGPDIDQPIVGWPIVIEVSVDVQVFDPANGVTVSIQEEVISGVFTDLATDLVLPLGLTGRGTTMLPLTIEVGKRYRVAMRSVLGGAAVTIVRGGMMRFIGYGGEFKSDLG